MATHTDKASTPHAKWLAIAASFVWLAAWMLIPGAFVVWATMFAVYVFAIAVAILVTPSVAAAPGFREWRARFFATGGWVVLSGLLTLAYMAVAGLALYLIGLVAGSG